MEIISVVQGSTPPSIYGYLPMSTLQPFHGVQFKYRLHAMKTSAIPKVGLGNIRSSKTIHSEFNRFPFYITE